MKDRTEILEILSNHEVKELKPSWEVKISTASEFYFRLLIPKDVNEWFIDLYEDGSSEKVWSGWSDWYLDGEVTKNNVEYCFQKDIEYFIERINSATDFKVVEESGVKLFEKEFSKIKNLEAFINEKWIQIAPGELPEDYEIPKSVV